MLKTILLIYVVGLVFLLFWDHIGRYIFGFFTEFIDDVLMEIKFANDKVFVFIMLLYPFLAAILLFGRFMDFLSYIRQAASRLTKATGQPS